MRINKSCEGSREGVLAEAHRCGGRGGDIGWWMGPLSNSNFDNLFIPPPSLRSLRLCENLSRLVPSYGFDPSILQHLVHPGIYEIACNRIPSRQAVIVATVTPLTKLP